MCARWRMRTAWCSSSRVGNRCAGNPDIHDAAVASDGRRHSDGGSQVVPLKLGARSENPLEWLALVAGLVPTPLFDTMLAQLLARTVMVGTRLGVFEALAA